MNNAEPDLSANQILIRGVLDEYRKQDETLNEAVERFGSEVVCRSGRTVYRWYMGEAAIPPDCLTRIIEFLGRQKKR